MPSADSTSPLQGPTSLTPPRTGRRSFGALAWGIESAVLVAVLVLGVALWSWQEHQVAGQAASDPAPAAASESPSPASAPVAPPREVQLAESSAAPAPGKPVAPAAGAKEQAGATPRNHDLYYRWQDGQPYSYRISCKAEIGDTLLDLSGTNTYTAGRPPVTSSFGSSSEARQGSGTAFVVSADGYLVTCDHVVRGATDIKVTLGNQTTPCTVVARDSAHDVAVLHVARQGLPVLPLADSETVELAEEVRAVGFPLSDVLGSSVKITQGSVAGIVTKPRGTVFQIDAVVNPGNSGGPLFNSRGVVIGVVNAQLVGLQISKVGFAVPVNYAKTLLTRHHVAFQTAAGDKLDGPTLAKRVSPSVALVTMLCHGGDFSEDEEPALHFHGVLDRRKQPRATAAASAAPPPVESSERDDGRLIVDDHGEISQSSGHVNLPCLLGPLATVAINPLPASGEKTLQRQDVLTITTSARGPQDPLAGIHPPGFLERQFVPHTGGPFSDPGEPEFHDAAVQETSYTVDAPKGDTVVIHKSLKLKTKESAGADPKFELTGAGETVFDLKEGVPQKVTFAGTFTMRENGQTLQVPVTFRCERITGSEALATSPATSTAAPAVVAPPESAESVKARLDGFLADLRAADKDWGKCFQALQGLSMMRPVEDRRDEVAGVLNEYLAEKNYSARSSALRAVQVWGTRRNGPALVRLVNPTETDAIRRRAIDVLGSLGDERAAVAIAGRIKDPADRASAVRALRALGPVAEDAAIGLLADQDPEVRDEACKLLGEIGGAKSIAALKEQVGKGDDSTRSRVNAALEKLQKKP